MTPSNVWLWMLTEFYFRRSRELWEIETPFWKNAYKIPYALGLRAAAVIWSHLVILESLLERQKGSGAYPGDIDMRGSCVLLHGHWRWQESIWSPFSSFLVLGPSPTTAHQPVSTNTERPQVKKVAGQGQSPATGGQATLRSWKPTATHGHSPGQQRAQDLAIPTSEQTSVKNVLGGPRPQP